MSDIFTYEKSEEHGGYVVFDNLFEPILETLEYTSTLDSWNTKKNVAIALTHWYEFLNSRHLNFKEVKTKHIADFRNWLKTPPEYRRKNNIYIMHQKPHITGSTWMQYQSRISGFYQKYVLPRFPDCHINFKVKTNYVPNRLYSREEKYLFKDKIKITSPLAKAIPIEDFIKILNACTNNRDKLMLEFFYKTGVRRGELFNISIEQFKHIPRGENYPIFTMYIHDSYNSSAEKQTKTGGREVHIATGLAERISAYIDNKIDGRVVNKNKHNELFTALKTVGETRKGDPVKGRYIYDIFKRAAKKAGFPKYTIHHCRHSFVTNMLSQQVGIKDAMDQTGHKNPETLFKYRTSYHEVPEDIAIAIGEIESQFRIWR